ncbi:hypothetical protein [Ekhidna sp.]|uniref:hypothetical protein n=1 Tax=Ekhidna sp. TaxID=2608089 RepID=UPI003BA977DC
MGIRLLLRLLKASILLLQAYIVEAQDWQHVKTIALKKSVTAYASDYKGDFYLGFADGGFTKYDGNGNLLENFSLSNTSSITLIDVQNNLRPFLFYFDIQQITILDRFSAVPKNYHLADFGIQLGMMACPAPDGDIWVVENNPQRLKKISALRKNTVLEVQIHLGDSVNKMQAYQNLLFISHTNGLHMLDQFGGKIYSFDWTGILDFQLIGNKVLVFSKKKAIMLNFKGEVEKEFSKPELSEGSLKLQERFLFFEGKTFSLYNYID